MQLRGYEIFLSVEDHALILQLAQSMTDHLNHERLSHQRVLSEGVMSTEEGIYCATAGSVFTNKHAFTEHYKSDFHLYNLKRRVAGLPPVTREWFEARKAQVLAAAAEKPKQQVWTDPLTKKKFQSEATYQAYLQSKKYQSLLKQASLSTPPPPIVTAKPDKPSTHRNFPSG